MTLEEQAKGFRAGYERLDFVLKKHLLVEVDFAEKNPPDFTEKDHSAFRPSLQIRDRQIWRAALAFVRSLLEEPKEK